MFGTYFLYAYAGIEVFAAHDGVYITQMYVENGG